MKMKQDHKTKIEYDLHPDFKPAKFFHTFMNPFIIKIINSVNSFMINKVKSNKEITIQNRKLMSKDGGFFNIKVIKPISKEKKMPCIIHFHGGGFMYKAYPLVLRHSIVYAKNIKCAVIMVDYRLSPKYPFPKGFEDCYKAFEWASSQPEFDSDRIVLSGESAGGALAAAVAQKARDIHGPKVCYQMLIYPVTDDSLNTKSMKTYLKAPIWTVNNNKIMWNRYLRHGDYNMKSYAAPLKAKSFKNLPSAYIEVAEFDCLRDEGIRYGQLLKEAGVDTEIRIVKGAMHGYDGFAYSKITKEQMQYRIKLLRSKLWKDKIGIS